MKKRSRAPRADGARNREHLLAAAEEEFGERGIDASVADIARRAGVAKATFFRHFATKDDVITAIVEPHIIELAEVGERLLEGCDPGAALLEFLTESAARRQQRDVSFLLRPGNAPPRLAELRDRVYATVEQLVTRAQASGAIRKDVTTADVFLLMCAPNHVVEYLPDPEPELWRRYLAIIFDGLRPQGAHPLPRPAPVMPS
jgi:AcrR family transcriptional regulator